jgi:hypothetical protein
MAADKEQTRPGNPGYDHKHAECFNPAADKADPVVQ